MKEKHEIEYGVGRDQSEFPGDASYSVLDSWEVYCWEDHSQVIPKQASQTLLDGPPFPAALGHPVLWGVTTEASRRSCKKNYMCNTIQQYTLPIVTMCVLLHSLR